MQNAARQHRILHRTSRRDASSTCMTESMEIQPVAGPIRGRVRPPGSKSITNRALVCAALAEGVSTLTGALDSEDTRVMIDGLGRAGHRRRVARRRDARSSSTAAGGRIPALEAELFCRQQRHDDAVSHGARDARPRRVSARRRRADARAADRRLARRAQSTRRACDERKRQRLPAGRRARQRPARRHAQQFAATFRASSSAAC